MWTTIYGSLFSTLLLLFHPGGARAQNETAAATENFPLPTQLNATANVTLPTEHSAPVIAVDGTVQNVQNASIPDVVIMTRSTLLGSVAQWLQAVMTVVCGGESAPAVAFFHCINHAPSIPALWAAMGLNSTSIQVQTIQTTQISGQNASVDANSLLTLLSSNVTQLNDLLQQITAHLGDFCLNVPPLMQCVRPFLQACITSTGLRVDQFARNGLMNGKVPAPEVVNKEIASVTNETVVANTGSMNVTEVTTGNTTVTEVTAANANVTEAPQLQNATAVQANVAVNSSAQEIAGNSNATINADPVFNQINVTETNITGQARELDVETIKLIQAQAAAPVSKVWFNANFPLSHSADDVAQFVQASLEHLCQNQSEKLTTVVSNVACIFNAISMPSCSNEILDLNQAQASQENVCKAAMEYGSCYLSSINSVCNNPALTGIFTDLGVAYFGATECAKNHTTH
ncbi:uncharacterized protein LOC129590966 isoform X2 [Paramacrobiotus metropolitanus]|uniref:uncharacterized protein LOC129590966 isoform X2 n=1 Tax=Paramacrobiotus metropolitanus TaxID=2943436 RepID=UPI0024458BDD|nr:uncharacterized protein LOC129590966 isoform X2 [Paramacrobiotus metropolitanus]